LSYIGKMARSTLKILFLVVKPFLNSRKDFRNIETEFYHFLNTRKQGITGLNVKYQKQGKVNS
jgi:hypothetical protein